MAPLPMFLPLLLGLIPPFSFPFLKLSPVPPTVCMADTGTLRFRSTRVVDASIGFDGADPLADLTADRAVYISNDGRRQSTQLLNVGHKRPCLKPCNLDDRLAEWVLVDDAEVNLDADMLDKFDRVSGTGKRKRYESSDDPMGQWRKEKQSFLDAMLRWEGFGDAMEDPACAHCDKSLGTDRAESERVFCCTECGEFLQCLQCCLHHHRMAPLHFLEEWQGQFWERTTLTSIGLVYHVGHGSRPCESPAVNVDTMVIIDTSGIHTVKYQYCGCSVSRQVSKLSLLLRNGWYPATLTDPSTCATFRALDFFRLLNVVGNVNAHDFITALERRTNALASTGIEWLADTYKAFGRMSRQFAFLQRARRSGRAHDAAKLAATKRGEMMVICWACPYDRQNLPPDWRNVDPKYKFLYMLILALDTNFKLKNRLRANKRYNPSLGPGWGAFVEPEAYREHLKNYVGESDISTCIAFVVLLQKDSRLTTGLRTSGVGGCVCARHECVRPNGLGDLQKGERYANMDYIIMSCLVGCALMMIMISYDIACQWKKNLRARNDNLPKEIRIDLDNMEVQCGLPVWHASSHEKECNNENSLSVLVGVGKSDGEGIERTWADINPASYHTKEMGIGNCADTLEDKLDSHNFMKNLGHCDALPRKLLVTLAERERQVEAFKEVNKTVNKEVRNVWQAQIDAFVRDHDEPNPYVLPNSGAPTEAQMRVALKQEEEEEIRQGKRRLYGTSAPAFLSAGIQLEDAQRRIHVELAGHALVTADRASKIHERRLAFMVKLAKFRKLQAIFTLGALRTMEVDEAGLDVEALDVKAEAIKLYMPSELSAVEREVGCLNNVVELEVRLRENQCQNALVQLRGHLHSKRHLIGFRNTHVSGQVKATKARTLIAQVGERAEACANKYSQGRLALTRLCGADFTPHLKVMKSADITLDGEEESSDTAARKKLAMIGAGKGARAPRHVVGTSKKEKALHESLRVEWCRTKARKRRWEEMHRVLRYLEWQSGWWLARVSVCDREPVELRAGLAAYARRQADVYARLQAHFRKQWSQSIGKIATAMVEDPVEEGADLVQLFA
ncbi:hypothetical protein C8F04DRAFT_1269674 [Mycena alexandri]|uniref:CxC2-like cysteine cluster KDZ transposase-associated domain-containing protein n=1 Tax=Mycena alexandri TaxID=1745969 RepID=A0AAD6SD65_9AGAR|nr:hypothetical protein C8F04DRAFT_1269674 [Mycena alexandri]